MKARAARRHSHYRQLDQQQAGRPHTVVGVAALLVLLLDGAQPVAQGPRVACEGGRHVQHPQRRRRCVVKVLAVRLHATCMGATSVPA